MQFTRSGQTGKWLPCRLAHGATTEQRIYSSLRTKLAIALPAVFMLLFKLLDKYLA